MNLQWRGLKTCCDGKARIFRDTAVSNLTDFFARFGEISTRSNPELDSLVNQAQEIVAGVEPNQLRGNADLRTTVSTALGAISEQLDGMMIDKPTRGISDLPDE